MALQSAAGIDVGGEGKLVRVLDLMDLVLDLVLGLMLVRGPSALLMDLVLVDVVLGLMTSSSSSSTWCSPDGRGAGRRGAHRIDARSWLWREAAGQFGSEVADWRRARWKTQRGIDNPAILR